MKKILSYESQLVNWIEREDYNAIILMSFNKTKGIELFLESNFERLIKTAEKKDNKKVLLSLLICFNLNKVTDETLNLISDDSRYAVESLRSGAGESALDILNGFDSWRKVTMVM